MATQKEFKRKQVAILVLRLNEKRKFIQVLAGPRQTGKTTIARQVSDVMRKPVHYASADEPMVRSTVWLEQQWETARATAKNGSVLILDEIQKIPEWSETVKHLWDSDTRNKVNLHVVVLGSAPLLVQKGLTESLTGRFEILHVNHWSLTEMRDAFGFRLDEYLYYGGYPGSAELINDRNRWMQYINDSLIETTISRDILLMSRVDKPALLRQLFHIGSSYSGQIVSYQKLLGQLHDAGNTTTLAHYLQLLRGAGILGGIQKYSGTKIRQRSSSPKLAVLNTALMTTQSHLSLTETKSQPELWGRLVESSVAAHLMNSSLGTAIQVYYWREGNHEVDFIL
ncbi:MAG TPA: ATP-binding protein, partial [Saprospiraceae bacterium]|nr:ATP-binding protein [Saprospiraceae bacterium]